MLLNDAAYGFFVGLIVIGVVLYVFATATLVFRHDRALADIFALFGTGLWGTAMAIFFFFLSDPQPRHSGRR